MKSWTKGKKKQQKWSKRDISKTDLKDDSDLTNQYLAQELQVESVPLNLNSSGKRKNKEKARRQKRQKPGMSTETTNLGKSDNNGGEKNNKAKVHPGYCVDQGSTEHFKDNTSEGRTQSCNKAQLHKQQHSYQFTYLERASFALQLENQIQIYGPLAMPGGQPITGWDIYPSQGGITKSLVKKKKKGSNLV